MENHRRGARIRARRTQPADTDTMPPITVGPVPLPPGGVRLDRPNRGPAAPEGSYMTMRDFDPAAIAARKTDAVELGDGDL